MSEARRGYGGRGNSWDAARLRALRRHLDLTQQQMAGELGVRQQTISEWETGAYAPRGATARLLGIVAERAEFAYTPASGRCSAEDGAAPPDPPGGQTP